MKLNINTEKNLEDKLTPKELEKLDVKEIQKQKAKKSELSPEKQIKKLEGEMENRQQEMTRLTESIKEAKAKLNETRKKLGLAPTKEEPPYKSSEKDRIEKLKVEQEALKKQKEELLSQQERERLIREEKEKILQEKLDELFKEFESLNPRDFESILKGGKTTEGRNVESKSMGSLDPEVAQSLAKVFKQGIKLLPKILEALPDLLKKFDENLTKEATGRVDKKLKEEKVKMEEEQKKEEEPKSKKEPKTPESEIPPAEVKSETSPIQG